MQITKQKVFSAILFFVSSNVNVFPCPPHSTFSACLSLMSLPHMLSTPPPHLLHFKPSHLSPSSTPHTRSTCSRVPPSPHLFSFPLSSGIDYMLQAKLAEGRAMEAEQKMKGQCTLLSHVSHLIKCIEHGLV